MTSGFEQRAAPDRQWTLVRLQDQCRRVRNGVLRRNLCTEEEVDGLKPSDKDGYNHWIHYYAQLWRIYEREKFVTHGSDYSVQKLLAAQSDDPIEVTLLNQQTVSVHAKSEASLRVLEAQYWWLNWLNVRHEAIREQAESGNIEGVQSSPLPLLEAIVEETNYRVGLIMWAACHEGVGLPWGYGPLPDDVPDEWLDLHPIDVTRLENALAEVNVSRLRFLPKPKERGKGVTVDVFFAQRHKLTNRPIRELRMDHSLAAQIANVALAGYREDE